MKVEAIIIDDPDSTNSDDSSSDFDNIIDEVSRRNKYARPISAIKKIKQSRSYKENKKRNKINQDKSFGFQMMCLQLNGLNLSTKIIKENSSCDNLFLTNKIVDNVKLDKDYPVNNEFYFYKDNYKCEHPIFTSKLYKSIPYFISELEKKLPIKEWCLKLNNTQSYVFNKLNLYNINSSCIQFSSLIQNGFYSNIHHANSSIRRYRVFFKEMRYVFKVSAS